MSQRRPFYEGETIELLIPTRADVEDSSWLDWFNSQKTSRFTQHALFPNTVEKQLKFFDTLQNENRLALLVATKGEQRICGTVSLSGIDFRRSSAAIAIIMDTESTQGVHPLSSLEAMALLTTHAFDVLGLRRISAGQVYPDLERWNQLLELLGYRSEGFRRDAFVRGHTVSDEILLACLYSHYSELVSARNGSLWPGTKRMMELIRELPEESFSAALDTAHREIEKNYFGSRSIT